MKKLGYWGKHDVCVRCGQYIYNISIWLDPNRSNKTERPKEELPQAYLDILEKREWSVCDYTDDGRVELEWYSPAGEDFIVCVKVENFPDEILNYSDDFDPDEHIEMWVEARANGRQDVPGARRRPSGNSTRGGRKLSGSISTARFSPESCEPSLW